MSASKLQLDGCINLACAICETAFIDYVSSKRFLNKFNDYELLEEVEYYNDYRKLKNYCERLKNAKKLNNFQKTKLREFHKMQEPSRKPTWGEFEKIKRYWKAQQTIYDCIRFWQSEYFINITLGKGNYNAVIETAEREANK